MSDAINNFNGDWMSMLGGIGGSNNSLAELLSLLGNNKGLFGLGDVATGGLLSMGSTALGGIASLLGGKSDSQKSAQNVYNLAKNRIGQNVLDPSQYMADYQRASRDRNQAIGSRLDKQFGLDSGVGASSMAYQMEAPLAEFFLNMKTQNDKLKAQNDNALMAIMAQVSQMM